MPVRYASLRLRPVLGRVNGFGLTSIVERLALPSVLILVYELCLAVGVLSYTAPQIRIEIWIWAVIGPLTTGA